MRYIENPPNPWLTHSVEWIGEPPTAKIEVFEETETRSIISSNDSPDVAFDHSINCYRGCPHGCTYCFSRPTHEYLGYGAGTDFERKIIAKVNAPELLRKELMKPSWKGDEIVFSFTSDPYIPLEANYKLTRRCLEVCAEFRNPVGIVTKSALIRRDVDVLQETFGRGQRRSLLLDSVCRLRHCPRRRAFRAFAECALRSDEDFGRRRHPGWDRHRADDSRFVDRHSGTLAARERLRRHESFHQHAASARQRRSLFRTTAAREAADESRPRAESHPRCARWQAELQRLWRAHARQGPVLGSAAQVVRSLFQAARIQ